MALTGRADAPPLVAPDGIVRRAQALGAVLGVDVLALLGERAAIAGLRRAGDVSCGRAARLLAAADGWVAVNLPRDSDVEAVPAWLGLAPGPDMWGSVAGAARSRPAADLVQGAGPIGLPVAAVEEVEAGDGGAAPVLATTAGEAAALAEAPLVVDLSSLWAGPLCARLLRLRGARVVKVESLGRPDGARWGPSAFFRLMHDGARFVGLDLADPSGRRALRALIARADVVIEASRPRALRQLGIDVASIMAGPGPRVWISITGYGRDRDRVAFGDDAAAAGGLIAWDEHGPCFAADAAADPLAGVAAAAAATESLAKGGRWILDVAMARVAAHVAAPDAGRRWCVGAAPASTGCVSPARGGEPLRPVGADNAGVAAELEISIP